MTDNVSFCCRPLILIIVRGLHGSCRISDSTSIENVHKHRSCGSFILLDPASHTHVDCEQECCSFLVGCLSVMLILSAHVQRLWAHNLCVSLCYIAAHASLMEVEMLSGSLWH